MFTDPSDRVRTALKLDSRVHESNVLAAGSVRNELKRVILFQSSLRIELDLRANLAGGRGVDCICAPKRVEADICELLSKDRRDGGDEILGDFSVAFSTPEMGADDEEEQDCDVAFEFEVRERGALPDSIPRAIKVWKRGSRGRDGGS